ncbi:esterase-like activity of phytase family protein [Aquimarina sp. 2201CG14-23]|uniref:esterase-like activity of phytase family protein n=1 Tax=Aquimarina mycalae TaxID=3040073 RepID=UPI002477FED1|nr:esterase-like activity of phytase family protein [Aquimarina sp. 2201CG14-23]MDH7448293.1 esterase-like activity of phytase family protein [Aquimarina sp. 2201CG14-23]
MYTGTIRFITILLVSILMLSCSSGNIQKRNSIRIKYLDEYVIYNDSIFKGSKIGGLSGIEYHKQKEKYLLVCDDAKNPRFYEATLSIDNKEITNITINNLTNIKDLKNQFYDKKVLDLEAIRVFDKNQLIFTSEGSIKQHANPSIFITDTSGNSQENYRLPSYFLTNTNSKNKPRHNGVFEGLVSDIQNTGYWAAMELPLELDGTEPSFKDSGAPVRITHFNTSTKKADHQFTYPLDKLAKDPKGKFGVNGVTGLLQLTTQEFLIIERGYAAGYGTQGNTVKIYLATIDGVTNTLNFESLEDRKYNVAHKELLFDFESIRNQLTNQIVDNIEGITFGPILANGNQSLILVADNNFNPVTKQINQIILLEIINTL